MSKYFWKTFLLTWLQLGMITVGILLIAFLTGCATRNRCLDKFPPETHTRDSLVVEYRDTILRDTITVPGERITITAAISCPDVVFHQAARNGRLAAAVSIQNGQLRADFNTDSMKLAHQVEVRRLKQVIKNYAMRREVVTRYVKYVPWNIKLLIAGLSLMILGLLFRR